MKAHILLLLQVRKGLWSLPREEVKSHATLIHMAIHWFSTAASGCPSVCFWDLEALLAMESLLVLSRICSDMK